MRTLFGALVGAILGGAIVAGLTSYCGVQDYWPIVLAGLAAGIVMRWLASSERVSYLRGALAALATVLAMIGGPLVGAKLISQQKPSIAKIEAPASDAPDTVKNTGEGGDLGELELPPMPVLSGAKGTIGKQRDNTNPLDTVLVVVGCLLAYQVGKGAQSVTEAASDEAPAEGASENASDGGEESSDNVIDNA